MMTTQKGKALVYISLLIVLLAAASNGSAVRRLVRPVSGLADGSPNTHTVSSITYNGEKIYIYKAKANDFQDPWTWNFYYSPIMKPTEPTLSAVTVVGKQVHVSIVVGNEDLETKVLEELKHKFESDENKHSRSWTIAPLMMDAVMAYLTEDSVTPLVGVKPYRIRNPSELTLNLRFICTSPKEAAKVERRLFSGELIVELGIKFSAFRIPQTAFLSITAQQLQRTERKTTYGQDNNKTVNFIHRAKFSNYTAKFMHNLKTLLYAESEALMAQIDLKEMEAEFSRMLTNALEAMKTTTIAAGAYTEMWSSEDLKPDVITSEINNKFTLTDSTTETSGNTELHYNEESLSRSDYGASFYWWWWGFGGRYGHVDSRKKSSSSKISFRNFQHKLDKNDIRVEWQGRKLEVKSYNVRKIENVTSKLDVKMRKRIELAKELQGPLFQPVSFKTVLPPRKQSPRPKKPKVTYRKKPKKQLKQKKSPVRKAQVKKQPKRQQQRNEDD